MGRPMLASELELRLGKLNSRLMFEHNPYNNTKKALYHVDQRGKEFVCAYEAGMMPERSVFRVKVDYVPEDVEHIDRKDLGPQELIPGRGFVPKDGKNPYMKRVLIPWGEQMRGWRTVLIRLVAMGLLTPTQVETTFGADNTPEWQGQMGKTPLQRPW